MAKRVFVSFDFDNDRELKTLLAGQSKLPSSPFEFSDWSMKEAAPQQDWEDEAESRIKRSDLVLVMVGANTHQASGVLKEVEMARQNSIPIVQMIGPSGGNYTAVPNAGRLYAWNWDNLEKLLA